jgi:hypothetical protein
VKNEVTGLNSEERKLLALFRGLGSGQRETLLQFAEFLLSRAGPVTLQVPEPAPVPRPAEETVVKAIKRLIATYHMLDRAKLLHETAHYMTEHTIHGRSAPEVIDELESMFERHYRTLKEKQGQRS